MNIMGSSDGLTFVLKLPWTVSHSPGNPYEHLFRVSSHVSESNLGPRPLATGHLPDVERTPFIVFEHLRGVIRGSVHEMTVGQKSALRSAHERLSRLKPPEVIAHRTPHDYVASVFTRTARCREDHGPLSNTTRSCLDDFMGLQDAVDATSEHIVDWSGLFMHGDLHEGNIVFLGNEVRFLDLEDSAYGTPLLDLAYLRVQHLPPHSLDEMMQLLEGVDAGIVQTYEPLALIFAVSWTLERLTYLDSESVEPALMANSSQTAMRDYVKAKMKELKEHLF